MHSLVYFTSGQNGVCRIITLCIILLFTSPVSAQVQAEKVTEEIVVIGSHIRMDPEEVLNPVTRLERDELRYQGSPTVLDMIFNLPFSQGADGESDRFQGGGGGSGVGPDRATINIRGLGPSRSLVLINGRRTTWSPIPIGADTQLLVDVNMLPFIALENIDFLRDGAAASYGSDAIAGVMNFQTRSDFTGIEISANHKVIRGSGGDTEIGFIGGLDLAGGRGHITTSASGIRRSELEIYKRDWAIRPYSENPEGGWSSTGRPATFVPGNTTDVNTNGIIDPNCAALGGAPTSSNKRCRFQYTPFDNLVEKTRRWQSFTEAYWDLSDTVTLSAEFLYSESSVPDWNTSPSYPPNRVIAPERSLRANNPALVDMAIKYPEIYGPYAFCDDKTRCGWSGDAWDGVGWVLGRSFGQDGPLRSEPVKSKLTRWAIGLEGQLGNLDFTTSATWSFIFAQDHQGRCHELPGQTRTAGTGRRPMRAGGALTGSLTAGSNSTWQPCNSTRAGETACTGVRFPTACTAPIPRCRERNTTKTPTSTRIWITGSCSTTCSPSVSSGARPHCWCWKASPAALRRSSSWATRLISQSAHSGAGKPSKTDPSRAR